MQLQTQRARQAASRGVEHEAIERQEHEAEGDAQPLTEAEGMQAEAEAKQEQKEGEEEGQEDGTASDAIARLDEHSLAELIVSSLGRYLEKPILAVGSGAELFGMAARTGAQLLDLHGHLGRGHCHDDPRPAFRPST